MYTVASKYYGGLTPEQLATVVAAMSLAEAVARRFPRAELRARVAGRPGGKLSKWFLWSGGQSICEFGFGG